MPQTASLDGDCLWLTKGKVKEMFVDVVGNKLVV